MTNESPTDRFERIAAEFHAATGMLAPGKDQPGAMGGPAYDQRLDAFVTWTRERTARVERDAQRWRWIRGHLLVRDEQTLAGRRRPFLQLWFDIPLAPETPREVDAAVDKKMEAEDPTHAD